MHRFCLHNSAQLNAEINSPSLNKQSSCDACDATSFSTLPLYFDYTILKNCISNSTYSCSYLEEIRVAAAKKQQSCILHFFNCLIKIKNKKLMISRTELTKTGMQASLLLCYLLSTILSPSVFFFHGKSLKCNCI
jgi:hypothetical protein